jgi:hypothetical protein
VYVACLSVASVMPVPVVTMLSLGPAGVDRGMYGGGGAEGKWLLDGLTGPKADRAGDTAPLVLLRSSEDIETE